MSLDPRDMLLRRTSNAVFNYYFPRFKFDQLIKCPFCKSSSGFSYRVAKKGMDPGIYLGTCRNLTCTVCDNALDLIKRFHNLDHNRALQILEMFDKGATKKEIAKAITHCVADRTEEVRRNNY